MFRVTEGKNRHAEPKTVMLTPPKKTVMLTSQKTVMLTPQKNCHAEFISASQMEIEVAG